MTNVGPDGCDARDTAPEPPPRLYDEFVSVDTVPNDPLVLLLRFRSWSGLIAMNAIVSRPDAQLLARSIYDALEGEHVARERAQFERDGWFPDEG